MSMDNVTQILIAIIALFSSLFGAIIGYLGKAKKQAVIEARREQQQNDLFDRLFKEMEDIKKRLDVHNHYAEKFGEIEQSMIAIKKDIEYLRKEKK